MKKVTYQGRAKNFEAPDTLYDVLWCLWAVAGPIIGGVILMFSKFF